MLLSLACVGWGVREAAIPSPNDGCMTKNGNTTVASPKRTAGGAVGRASQLPDAKATNMSANTTPMV